MDRLDQALQEIKNKPGYKAVHGLMLGRALSDETSPIADLLFLRMQEFDSHWRNLSREERKTEPNKEEFFKMAALLVSAWLSTSDGSSGEFTHPQGPMHIMEGFCRSVYESKIIESVLNGIEPHIPRLQDGLYAAAFNTNLKNQDFIQRALQRNFTLTKECDVLAHFIGRQSESRYSKFLVMTSIDRMRGLQLLHDQGFDFSSTATNPTSSMLNPLSVVMPGDRTDSFLARGYLACKRNSDNERLFLRMLELQPLDTEQIHVSNDKTKMTLMELVEFCYTTGPDEYPDLTPHMKALNNKHVIAGLLDEVRGHHPRNRA